VNEFEAKYLLQAGKKADKVLRRTLQELSWAGYLAHPQATVDLHDVYFDTANWRLQQVGWSLRARTQDGVTRFCCKQLRRSTSGVFERQELTQNAPACSADRLEEALRELEPGPVADLLNAELPPDATLLRLFVVDNRRLRYRLSNLENPRALIEFSVDQTRVEAATTLNFTEFEAELKHGPRELLTEISAVLRHQNGLVPARVSKYHRGLQAAGCPPGNLQQRATTDLTPQSSWVELGLRNLRSQAQILRHAEPLAWESVHIEGVHEMRITTRRIRAALRAFAQVLPQNHARELATDIRWVGQALGEVRDLDVHLERLREYRDVLHPEDSLLLGTYQRHLLKARRQALSQLCRSLESERYARLTTHLREFLNLSRQQSPASASTTIENMAQAYLPPLIRRVLKRGRAICPDSPPERLHRLRIEIKRLRYQLEYLAGPYGELLAGITRRLRKLQNTLGNHQDAWVARDHLNSYRRHHELGKRENRLFKTLLRMEMEKSDKYHERFFGQWKKFERETLALQSSVG
jgi:CHAD domain-containing protein